MSYYSWAPVFNSFGTNNRSNSIRVPMGGGRCEYRNADSSLNPYLAATLCLAAGLEGIREDLDPGAPHAENLYELDDGALAAAGVQPLPRTLGEAVERVRRRSVRRAHARHGAARRVHPLQARRVGGIPPARERLGDQTLRDSSSDGRRSRDER